MTNMWDERYRKCEFFYGVNPNDFLKENAKLLKANSKVLCLAEGEGRNAVFLAALGHDVVAVDSSKVGLEKMQSLAKSKNLVIQDRVQDLADFDLGEASYDAIISIWCHLPSPLRKDLHQRCLRALRPQGLFLLEAYTPKQLEYKTGGPSNADFLVVLDDLKKDFSPLTILHGQELLRYIEEGEGHHGQSSVVQFIAQK